MKLNRIELTMEEVNIVLRLAFINPLLGLKNMSVHFAKRYLLRSQAESKLFAQEDVWDLQQEEKIILTTEVDLPQVKVTK